MASIVCLLAALVCSYANKLSHHGSSPSRSSSLSFTRPLARFYDPARCIQKQWTACKLCCPALLSNANEVPHHSDLLLLCYCSKQICTLFCPCLADRHFHITQISVVVLMQQTNPLLVPGGAASHNTQSKVVVSLQVSHPWHHWASGFDITMHHTFQQRC